VDSQGLLIHDAKRGHAFELLDVFSVGAAYTTHLFLHELGHQVVADEVEAKSHRIGFFTRKDGKFYPGISQYERIPTESKLPYALGGERMAGFTFEYALDSYRREPSSFNMALMFFSNFDFLAYSFLATYVSPDNPYYDPNLIRTEAHLSKTALVSMAAIKTLLNAYKIMDKKATFCPSILLDKDSAVFAICFEF
jgi:hypothetical protein